MLAYNGYCYGKNKTINNRTYWSCRSRSNGKYCKARLVTYECPTRDRGFVIDYTYIVHNHLAPNKRAEKAWSIKKESADYSD